MKALMRTWIRQLGLIDMQTYQVCRPQTLTRRWVEEMTSAIHILCPEHKPVICKEESPEMAWNTYYQTLSNSKCFRNPYVQKVLAYEIDYNKISDLPKSSDK